MPMDFVLLLLVKPLADAQASSAAAKRKRQAKMLRGGGNGSKPTSNGSTGEKNTTGGGIVTPTTVIAWLHLESDEKEKERNRKIPVYANVWGEVVEVNRKLTPRLLQKDPLLDGYIAIILPTGPFPPPSSNGQKHNNST